MADTTVMDIGEVAAETGLPASTLRYYEEKGLIQSVGRRGLRRQFEAGVVERLAFISLGRHAGFSLDEIARMMDGEGRFRIDRTQLLAKADDIDASIRVLTAMRDGLRHAAQCPAPSHFECPTFTRFLRLAGKRPARTGKTLGL